MATRRKVIYKVTAGGSVVMETLFPGTDHEMISMYHLEKGELIATHYCAMGNQPRMKLSKATPSELTFDFVGGRRDRSGEIHAHHGGTITLRPDGKMEALWRVFRGGKEIAQNKFFLQRGRWENDESPITNERNELSKPSRPARASRAARSSLLRSILVIGPRRWRTGLMAGRCLWASWSLVISRPSAPTRLLPMSASVRSRISKVTSRSKSRRRVRSGKRAPRKCASASWFQQGLFPLPTKTPLNAVVHGRIEREDYTVEKVFFEAMPGFFVTGNLYRPRGKTGPHPAVLCAHWALGGRALS
jgi:hypothetical protein